MLTLKIFYSDLRHCQPTSRLNDEPRGSSSSDEVLHYIELTMRVDTVGVESTRKPLVRCESEALAKWVCTWLIVEHGNPCAVFICATGFELYSEMKLAVFSDVAPCSPVETDWRFRGAYHWHIGQNLPDYMVQNLGRPPYLNLLREHYTSPCSEMLASLNFQIRKGCYLFIPLQCVICNVIGFMKLELCV